MRWCIIFANIYFHFLAQETQAVHLCVGSGSHVQIFQPWRVHEYGYMSSVVAHLQKVEASTSLEFRQFLEAENVKVSLIIK